MKQVGTNHVCELKNRLVKFKPEARATSGVIHRPYFINPGDKSDYVLDVSKISKKEGAATYLWEKWNGPNQKWRMDEKNRLISVNSGLCLNVDGGRIDASAQIVQSTCGEDNSQKWILSDAQQLRPSHAPNKCLETTQNAFTSQQNGGRLFIKDCLQGAPTQTWTIRAAPTTHQGAPPKK